MANPEHVEVVKSGAQAIADWRKDNPHTQLDLEFANLSAVNLDEANLREANLRGAMLTECSFRRSILNGTDLFQAQLQGADFDGATLRDAELVGAVLQSASFRETQLRKTDFHVAYCGWTVFADVDLSVAMHLESVEHWGPSTIGSDTLTRSRGHIPEKFLRGCGLSEDLIVYVPSLFQELTPVQYYSCFISYSHADEEFCQRLHSRMQQEKLRVWYAPEDMPSGKKIHESIDCAIRLHDKLLLVLTEHSMRSAWVEQEIYNAMDRERRENKRVLFPIRLVDYDTLVDWKMPPFHGKDMAREIREYFIPDFSNWKDHDAFEAAFGKLLRDLKNDERPAK